MKKQTPFNVTAIAASVFLAAGTVLAADESATGANPNNNSYNGPDSSMSSANQGSGQEIRASKIIGKSVKNAQNQTVCEVRDLVVDLNNGSTHIAIVSVGSVAGMGGKRVAVPLDMIQFAPDGTLTMSATRRDLVKASGTPSGSWAFASGEEWTRGIAAYYGQPGAVNGQYERESAQPDNSGREPVRSGTDEQSPKAGEQQQNGAQNNPAQ